MRVRGSRSKCLQPDSADSRASKVCSRATPGLYGRPSTDYGLSRCFKIFLQIGSIPRERTLRFLLIRETVSISDQAGCASARRCMFYHRRTRAFRTVSNIAIHHLRKCGLDGRPLHYHKQCNMMHTMAVSISVGKYALQEKWREMIRIYKSLALQFNVLFSISFILYTTLTTSLLYIYIHYLAYIYPLPHSLIYTPIPTLAHSYISSTKWGRCSTDDEGLTRGLR
jgi:hypothetical protein